MLSPARVTEGNRRYWTEKVAQSAEEYYSGKGEAEGTWLGKLSLELGLKGQVDPEEFSAVLDGKNPATTETLSPSFDNRKVNGVDMTLSPPKSVSVMWAIGEPRIRKEIRAAHDQAVLESFNYMQDMCAWGRKGKGGTRKVQASGLVAAAYPHRTSRAGDPQLHTHVVAGNMVAFPDGTYGSLDTARIWHHAPTGSRVYQLALRREMTARLGVEWGEIHHGIADVKDFPQDVADLFSKRALAIQEAAEKTGSTSAHTRQIQTLATRQKKTITANISIHDDWAAEAATLGFTKLSVRQFCKGAQLENFTPAAIQSTLEKIAQDEVLTKDRAFFDRRDVIAAIIDQAPPTAKLEQIEAAAERVISETTVPIIEQGAPDSDAARKIQTAGLHPMTTPQMLKAERRAIKSITTRANSGVGQIKSEGLDERITKLAPTIGADQRAMVTHILTSGNGVDAVEGDAGTGKTYALNVVREIYEQQGYRVIGASLAATAAKQMTDGAQIEASTIASLRARISMRGAENVIKPKKTILLVDEAAMAGTKDLVSLIRTAEEHDLKIVLIGDDKQLPSIEAGGLFRQTIDLVGSARLTENRRQLNPEQREIVDAFKSHQGQAALMLADNLDQLHIHDTHEANLAELFDSWASDPRRIESLMVAGLRRDVRDLNDLAQARLLADGEIQPAHLTTPDNYTFHVGDRIRCRARDEAGQVRNGLTGTVAKIDKRKSSITVRLDEGRTVILDHDYLNSKSHIELGYAMTTHSSQGSTCRNVYALLTENVFAELAYTAASRAKNKIELYVTRAGTYLEEAGFDPEKKYEPLEHVIHALNKSKRQTTASSVGITDDYSEYPASEIAAVIREHRQLRNKQIDRELHDARRDPDLAPEELEHLEVEARNRYAVANPLAAAEYVALNQELERRVAQKTILASHNPPSYLVKELGRINRHNAYAWRDAAKHIERHRLSFDVTDPSQAYGRKTDNLTQQRAAANAKAAVKRAKPAIAQAVRELPGRAL